MGKEGGVKLKFYLSFPILPASGLLAAASKANCNGPMMPGKCFQNNRAPRPVRSRSLQALWPVSHAILAS